MVAEGREARLHVNRQRVIDPHADAAASRCFWTASRSSKTNDELVEDVTISCHLRGNQDLAGKPAILQRLCVEGGVFSVGRESSDRDGVASLEGWRPARHQCGSFRRRTGGSRSSIGRACEEKTSSSRRGLVLRDDGAGIAESAEVL